MTRSRERARQGRSLYKEIIRTEGRVSERVDLYHRRSAPPRQLTFDSLLSGKNGNGFRDPAFSENKLQPLHRWVPWIAGFSAQFVEDCLDAFLRHRIHKSRPRILDPFAGVGTTLVQAVLNGYDAVGFEINPYAALACKVKLNAFKLDLAELESYLLDYQKTATKAGDTFETAGPDQFRTRIPFFSPGIAKQVSKFLHFVHEIPRAEVADVFRVAFGSVMVKFSNYTYEPSLGSRPGAGKPLVESADVHSVILAKLYEIISDIRWAQERMSSLSVVGEGQIHNLNFLKSEEALPAGSVDLMVTSPPYMNNYHYVRNTRPQLFWLSLVSSPRELKSLEEENFGKYWQTVRDGQPIDLCFNSVELSETVAAMRRTRKEKGSYGGPGWANYVASYFNDCYRFLRVLKRTMSRGGVGVIVIGNSIIQGHEIATDLVLANLAQDAGFHLEGVQRIRTKRVGNSITQSAVRRGKKNGASLYESAVILRKR